ncbi:HeLo domain-containing protein [Trichoderma simmonsii]|uniref:HeLo domain-containing protein n=1 Tax=Trichoderma simmonsii TaxID=1491479 RepID=A0A8G0PCM1_9HYPO|nr:HeLo domain-containing protein [Trichoderma simmonsii]
MVGGRGAWGLCIRSRCLPIYHSNPHCIQALLHDASQSLRLGNLYLIMAVGGTASIFHLVCQFASRIQQARAFEEEFDFYQLQLKVHLSRCATVSSTLCAINDSRNILAIRGTDDSTKASEDQEPTIADILSAIQNRLRKAQQEAEKVEADLLKFCPPRGADGLQSMRARMTGFIDKRKAQAAKTVEGIKWSFYKKDKYDKFIADISALIKHLERKVNINKEGLSLGNSPIIYIARAHSSAI